MINDDAVTTPGAYNEVMEQSQTVAKLLPVSQSKSETLFNRWSAKKTFGGSVLGNDNLQGTSSTDPTEQTFYTIFYATNDATSTTVIEMNVTIEYIAVWDELKDLVAN